MIWLCTTKLFIRVSEHSFDLKSASLLTIFIRSPRDENTLPPTPSHETLQRSIFSLYAVYHVLVDQTDVCLITPVIIIKVLYTNYKFGSFSLVFTC